MIGELAQTATSVDSSSAVVFVAAISSMSALLSAVLLSWLNTRNAIHMKQQDWDRQDEVAARAQAAQEESAKLLKAGNDQLAAQSGRLEQIHTLVNSAMTASMENELAALRSLAVLLSKVIDPDAPTLETIHTTHDRIALLVTQLEERRLATEEAEAQRKAMEKPQQVTIVADPDAAPLPVEVRTPKP